MRILLLIVVGIFILIKDVESRRVFGSTRTVINVPKFYPKTNKISHQFLPKEEYTMAYEKFVTSIYSPTTTPTTTVLTTTTTSSTTTTTPAATEETTLDVIVPGKTSTSTTSSTPSTTTKSFIPFITELPSTTTITTAASTLPSAATTTTTEGGSTVTTSRDGNFDWFGALIVLLITLVAITFFVVRRKCSSPSGTYRIPKTNLVPKDYYVNFCKIDDDFIEIHAKALYGPSYMTSIENQNFEGPKTEETCL